MKTILLPALLLASAAFADADKFIFSGDGIRPQSSPRDLPSQGVSRSTGNVVVGLYNLDDAGRADCGWYRIVPTPRPPAHSNEVWKIAGYVFAAATCSPHWECTWRKIPLREFSKYKIVRELQAAEAWPTVRAWLEADADAYDLWLAAEDVSEDDPILAAGIAAVKAQLGWSDEFIAEMLDRCTR